MESFFLRKALITQHLLHHVLSSIVLVWIIVDWFMMQTLVAQHFRLDSKYLVQILWQDVNVYYY